MNNTDPTDPPGLATHRPLSAYPPPTLPRPTAPPISPSDQLTPQTLVGTALRNTDGCVILTTEIGSYELVGDLRIDALAHPRVKVTGMPHPGQRGSCGLVVVEVTEVAPA